MSTKCKRTYASVNYILTVRPRCEELAVEKFPVSLSSALSSQELKNDPILIGKGRNENVWVVSLLPISFFQNQGNILTFQMTSIRPSRPAFVHKMVCPRPLSTKKGPWKIERLQTCQRLHLCPLLLDPHPENIKVGIQNGDKTPKVPLTPPPSIITFPWNRVQEGNFLLKAKLTRPAIQELPTIINCYGLIPTTSFTCVILIPIFQKWSLELANIQTVLQSPLAFLSPTESYPHHGCSLRQVVPETNHLVFLSLPTHSSWFSFLFTVPD